MDISVAQIGGGIAIIVVASFIIRIAIKKINFNNISNNSGNVIIGNENKIDDTKKKK
ncbi:MAG: hypothetical protein RL095_467 [Verrucomicrobiota bacterium]|jgi:hypothetical protein